MSPHFCSANRSALLLVTISLLAITPGNGRAEEGAGGGKAGSVTELLPDTLRDPRDRKLDPSVLEGKFVGLYFSAGGCRPCRAFTPTLVESRNRHLDEDFEVVLVSFDESNTDKQRYVYQADMKWPSFPGAGSREARALAEKLGVEGFPTLVILAPDGSVITRDGRLHVTRSAGTALESWKNAHSS